MEGCRWKWAANSPAGFRRGRSDGTGRFRGPASAKTKETPRQLVLRAALDYSASLSEVGKRKFRLTPLPSGEA